MLRNVEGPRSSQNVPVSLSEWDPAIGDGEKELYKENLNQKASVEMKLGAAYTDTKSPL